MTVWQYETGVFDVRFQAKPPGPIWEWFFRFGPDVDTIAEEFKGIILRVRGVRLHET